MGPRARYLGPEVPDGRAHLAGPDPEGQSPADRRAGHRRAQGQDPGFGPVASRSSFRPRGRRRPPSAAPTSAAARTAPASVSRRRRTGRSISPRSSRRCCKTLEGIQSGVQRDGDRRQEGLARRPDRARPAARASSRRRRTAGHDGDGAVHAGTHGRLAGADRRRVLRRARAGRRRLPQLPEGAATRCRPRRC